MTILVVLLCLFVTSTRGARYPIPINLTPNIKTRGGGAVSTKPRGGSTAIATRTMTANNMKLLNLFSGGIAGTIASCITNPLEVIKTQLQSSSVAVGELASASGSPGAIARKIMQTDGVSGFFRGLRPTLVGIIPSRSIYFYSYEQSKRLLGPMLPEGSVGNALISGLAAGVAGNTLTNPSKYEVRQFTIIEFSKYTLMNSISLGCQNTNAVIG